MRRPADSVAGTRAMAFSTKGAMRSISGVISPKEKSLGMCYDNNKSKIQRH